jgi:hypothetical protein
LKIKNINNMNKYTLKNQRAQSAIARAKRQEIGRRKHGADRQNKPHFASHRVIAKDFCG